MYVADTLGSSRERTGLGCVDLRSWIAQPKTPQTDEKVSYTW